MKHCKCPPNLRTFSDVCSYCSTKIINEEVKRWNKWRKKKNETI